MAAKIAKNGTRTQGSRILDICQQWQETDAPWAEDCAIVSRYYSGSIMESEEDQDTLGLIDHENFCVGRDTLLKAREETLAMVLQPQRLISLVMEDFEGTPTEKLAQERKASKAVDKFLRRTDKRFLTEIEKMVDRHVAHGDALMMLPPEGDGWRPFSARILTDHDAPQNPHDDGFARWAIYSDLQLGDALTAISIGQKGWKPGAQNYLKDLWERRYDAVDSESGNHVVHTSTFDEAMTLLEHISSEEWAAQGSIGENLMEFYNSRYRCFYYYQKDFTNPEKGIPVDFYIIARFEPGPGAEHAPPEGDPLLYAQKAAYSDVSKAIFPFVLDTNLGVESPSWGTIKGLGHVNYEADRCVNLLVSSMMNGAIDRNTPLMEVSDEADVDKIRKFIRDGYKANSIVPSGVQFVDKSKNTMQVGEALNMISFLQSMSNKNAVGHTGQSSGQSGELRVETLARQQQDQKTASNRGQLFIQKLEPLLKESVLRLVEEIDSPVFFGRAQAQTKELREELKKKGVMLEWLYRDNVDVRYSRLLGDGDPGQRAIKAQRLVDNIGLVPAEERNGVLMEWFAETTGDWERAENVFESADIQAPEQEAQALGKAADMLRLGVAYPVTRDDVPERQIPVFLRVGQSIVDGAIAAGKFSSEQEFRGFAAIGQHTVLLIQQLEQRGQKDLAKSFGNEVQRIATEAQEPLNNFRQAREAQQDPKLQMDAQKLQLQAAKEAREERTFAHKQQKDILQVQGKQQQQEFNQILQGRRLLVEEERAALEKLKATEEMIAERLAKFDR